MPEIFRRALLLFMLAGGVAATAHAAEHYECPYLDDPARQTISPLSQGKDGWFFRSADFTQHFSLLPHTVTLLKRLDRAFVSQGSRLIILSIPPRIFAAPTMLDKTQPMQDVYEYESALRSYKAYLQSLRTTGIPVADLLDHIADQEPGSNLHFFFKRDHHWTPFGARLSAQKVADIIKRSDNDALRQEAYRTSAETAIPIKGEMMQELRTLCTDAISEETFQPYSTVRKQDAAAGADALFGDEESVPIVVLGSSFTATEAFNFDGFLSEQSGLNAANFAIGAGMLFNAMVSYATLPQEKRLHPQFIVWEALSHYDFNKGMAMFRQVIPAVYGECSAEKAIATKRMEVKQGKGGQLFELSSELNIAGPDYYLFLASDNPALDHVTLKMEYADGDGEWFRIDQRQNFNHAGRFFMELSDEVKTPLTKIRIEDLSDINATIEARLCKSAGGEI